MAFRSEEFVQVLHPFLGLGGGGCRSRFRVQRRLRVGLGYEFLRFRFLGPGFQLTLEDIGGYPRQ